MDYADRDELIAELNALLEAERAGARVGAGMLAEARDEEFKALAKTIQADEVKWAGELFNALVWLQADPSDAVGDFYGKAMAIDDLAARIAFLNRGQGWVVRKLREIIPCVRDAALHEDLNHMLSSHIANITLANSADTRIPGEAMP